MGSRKIARRFVFSVSLLTVLFSALPAESVNLDLTPSLALSAGYDSNILSSTTANQISDYVMKVEPQLLFSLSLYNSSLNIRGGFVYEKYIENPELSNFSDSNYFSLGLGKSETLQISPRLLLTPSVRYFQTADYLIQQRETGQTSSAALPPGDQSGTKTTTLREVGGGIDLSYLLTSRVTTAVGVGYVLRNYTEAASGYSSSSVFSGAASASYAVTPTFSAGMFVGVSNNNFKDNPDSMTYAGGIKGSNTLTQTLLLDWRLGTNVTKVDAGPGTPENSERSPYAYLSLNYTRPLFNASLYGTFGQAGGGVYGLTTQRFTVGLSATTQFTGRWQGNMNGSYQRNQSFDDPPSIDSSILSGYMGVNYQVLEWASANMNVTAYRQGGVNPGVQPYNRYAAFLGITFGKAYRLY